MATRADLRISAGSATGSFTKGGRVTARVTLKNQGASTYRKFYTRYYLSTDSRITTRDTYLDSDSTYGLRSGRSWGESESFGLPSNLIAGKTYYIGAIVDYSGRVSESNENNNVRVLKSFKVPDAIQPSRKPDLVVTSGTARATSGVLKGGSRVYANATVKNQGAATAGSSYVGYYLSTDRTITSSDTRLDRDYVSSLSAGRSGNEYEYFNLPTNLTAGRTYYIGALADYSGRVGESNEGNNGRVLKSFTVQSPDLVVTSGGVTGSFQAGGRVRASATIRNQRQGAAGSSYVGYYLSTDSTITSSDTRLDRDYVSSLSAGRSGNEYEYFNLPTNLTAGRTYYIGALADYSGRVSESNEGNNGRVLKSFTVQSPDLVVSSGSVTGNFQAGGRVRASATIKNQGQGGSAGSSYVGYYLSTDSTITSGDTRLDRDYVSSLSAGRSGYEYEYFNLPTNLTAGRTYYIGALADYSGRVSESNEGNNGRVLKSFTVQSSDLVVSSGSVTGNFQAGGRVRASATIRNQRQGATGSSYVGYYLSTDSTITSGDIRLDYDYVSSLSAGRSGNEYEYFNLPTNLTTGQTYYIGALADYSGRVSESNEGNNGRVLKSFTVQSPDLVVSSGSVTGNFQAGGRVRASATIKNQGQGAAGSSYVGYYLSTDSTITSGDIRLDRDYVSGLSAGRSGNEYEYFNLPTNLTTGQTYYIGALADYSGRVSESNEENNGRVLKEFEVQASDLTISAGNATGSFTNGGRVTVNVTLKNQGASTSSTFYTRYYLSTDSTITTDDTYLDYDSTWGLSSGNTWKESASFNLPVNLISGKTYYIGAITDYNGRVSESNEHNNSRILNQFKFQSVPKKTAEQLFKSRDKYSNGKYASLAFFSNQAYETKVNWTGWEPLLADTLNLHSESSIRYSFSFDKGIYEYDGRLDPSMPRAIVARSADAVLISFRGTASTGDKTDWLDIPDRYKKFEALTKAVDEYVSNDHSIKKVYVTGHSLGGGTAEEYMWNHKNYGSYGSGNNKVTYESVVFASSGTGSSRTQKDHDRILAIEIAGDLTPDKPTLGHLGKNFHYVPQGDGQLSPVQGCDFHSMDLYQSITDKLETFNFSLGNHKHDDHVIVALKKDQIREVIDEGNTLEGDLWTYSNEDLIFGGNENDVLNGKNKSDQLFGGPGNDTLGGGDGNDRLFGGSGNDTYVYWRDDGSDTIDEQGFGGSDTLEVWDNHSMVDLDNFNDLRYMTSGNDLIINLDIDGALGTSDFNSGRVTIIDQGTASSQIEDLELYDDDSQLIGGAPIDLASVWDVVHRESVTSLSNLTFSSTLNDQGRYQALAVA